MSTGQYSKEIVACGERVGVMIADCDADWNDRKNIKWSWSPDESAGLSGEEKELFMYIDECKPVMGLTHLLISSSFRGAVALLEKSTKKIKFLARGVNAHSAELLPDGNIADALSGGGDVLRVHCTLEGAAYSVSYPLELGHGVVWDKKRRLLWALAKDEIRSYTYNMNRSRPELALKKSFKIPGLDICGHDLFARAGKDSLFFTQEKGVYEFNIEKETIAEFPPVKGCIKSFGENGPDGRIVYQKAAEGEGCYWNEKLFFLNPPGENVLSGARFYKARWNRVSEFSY